MDSCILNYFFLGLTGLVVPGPRPPVEGAGLPGVLTGLEVTGPRPPLLGGSGLPGLLPRGRTDPDGTAPGGAGLPGVGAGAGLPGSGRHLPGLVVPGWDLIGPRGPVKTPSC